MAASSSSSSSSPSSHVGFSIREYTAEMRETDISKCWPFVGCGRSRGERTAEVEEEEAGELFLPPIRVVKFRWWLDVLATARSRKEIDLADAISLGSVVRRGSGLRFARANDDDDDRGYDCAADEMGLLRIKKKKKKKERSIVEIFAVSPRVVARAKKKARATSKKKKKKNKKRVKAKVKTCGSITGTRVFEAKKVLGRKIHETSSTTGIDEVTLRTHGSIFQI